MMASSSTSPTVYPRPEHCKDPGNIPSNCVFIMYHGTRAGNVQSILEDGFRCSSNGMLGRGVYVSTDPTKANDYGDVTLTLFVYTRQVRQ